MKWFAKNFILNPNGNYLLAVGLFVGLFLFLKFLYPTENFFLYAFYVVLSFLLVWKSKFTVPPRKRQHLIDFVGEETNVWIQSTTRFHFYLFRLDDKLETHDLERDKIEVPAFEFNDVRKKKCVGALTAIWKIGDSDEAKENFKLMKTESMKEDLITYLKRSAIRQFSQKTLEEIQKDAHIFLNTDPEVKMYGVVFSHIDPVVLSGNMTQDDLNAFEQELFERFKLEYGYAANTPNNDIPKAQLDKIHDRIEVQTKLAKKIIGNAKPLVRYDGDKIGDDGDI